MHVPQTACIDNSRRQPFTFTGMLAVTVFSGLWVLPAGALEPDQIFDKVSPSIVLVLATDEKSYVQGSGVVVAPQRVVTNCHVVAKRRDVLIKWGDLKFAASVTDVDTVRDLCLLSVPELRAPVVTLRKLDTLRVGQRVYAIGNPEGLELTLTEGLVSALRTKRGDRMIQTSAAITHGSSGGGLFDLEGRLIGVTTSGVKEGLGLNFAIPADYIAEIARPATAAVVAPPATIGGKTATNDAAVEHAKVPAFPRRLSGVEIAAHFAKLTKVEVNRGHRSFTLKIRGAMLDRYCAVCRVAFGDGELKIKQNENLACFHWSNVTYPDSGCYQVVQKSENNFVVSETNRDVTIMEYSVSQTP